MLFGREQFTITTEMDGEVIDKLYAKELIPTPIEEFEKLPEDQKKLHKPYPFEQRTYEAAPGILCDQDVAVPMRDGVILYADVFRPADSAVKVPAILAWSNYGKRPNEYRPDELKAYTPGVPAGSISDSANFEAADLGDEGYQLLVSLDYGVAKLRAIRVEVGEQALEVVFAIGSQRGTLNAGKDARQLLVKVFPALNSSHAVFVYRLKHAREKLAGQDEKAPLLHRFRPAVFSLVVRKIAVIEAEVALLFGEVGAQVLADKAVEKRTQDVLLEVPAIDATAQVVGNGPDGLMELGSLLLFGNCHIGSTFLFQ